MAPTVRDRTQEFLETCKLFPPSTKKTINELNTTKSEDLSAEIIESSRRIHNTANQITSQILESKTKIKQLLILSRSTSNFRDNRPKIHELMGDLNNDIQKSINHSIKTLEIQAKKLFSSQNDNCSQHHLTLIKVIQLRHSELTKSFVKAAQITTQCLQKQKQQRDTFEHNKQRLRTVPRNRLRRRKENGTEEEGMHLLNDSGGFNDHVSMMEQAQGLVNYSEEKAEDAMKIEQELREISGMMGQLAEMVEQQKHTIIQIDENVNSANENMEGAINQLQKYLANLSNNRWLMIKVFAILIFFAIVFAVFIA